MRVSWIGQLCLCALLALSAAGAAGGEPDLAIRSHTMRVDISGRVATTTIEQVLVNYSDSDREMVFQWRMSDEAVVGELAMWVGGLRSPACIHPRSSARRIYREIVSQMRDPALLEHLGDGLWQLRVYPVPPSGTQKVELVCRQVLRASKGWLVYHGPVLAFGSAERAQDFDFCATVSAPGGVSDVKPHEHRLGVQRTGGGAVKVAFRKEGFDLTGPVEFGFVPHRPAEGAATARDGEQTYFAVVLPPLDGPPGAAGRGRNFVLVVDRSASMQGKRFDLARLGARLTLEKLTPADAFACVLAGADVATRRDKLAPATKGNVAEAVKHLEGLRPEGGTDLAAALRQAEAFNNDPARAFFIFLFSDAEDVVGAKPDETTRKPVPKNKADSLRLAPNCRLFALLPGGGGSMAGRLAEVTDAVLAEADDAKAVVDSIRAFLASAGRAAFTDARCELLDGGASAAADLCHSAVVQGQDIVLAGRCGRSGTIKVKLTGRLYGKDYQAVHELKVPAAPTGDPRPLWAGAALRQVWAHLRAEGMWRALRRKDARPRDLEALLAFSRSHRVPTAATAFLILESDEEYRRRGIERNCSTLGDWQTLSDAMTEWARRAPPAGGRGPDDLMARSRARARELRRLGHYARAARTLELALEAHGEDPAARREAALLREFIAMRESASPEGQAHVELAGARSWHDLLAPVGPVDFVPIPGRAVRQTQVLPPDDLRTMERMQRRVPKFETRQTPLKDVVQYFRDQTGVSFHVRWEALRGCNIDRASPVTVKLTGVSLEKALRTVLDDAGGAVPLGCVVNQGVITISTRYDLARHTIARVYDVQDLLPLARGRGRAAPPGALGGGGGLFGGDDDDEEALGQAGGGLGGPWGGETPGRGGFIPGGAAGVRLYDVQDLTPVVPVFRAPRVGLRRWGPGDGTDTDEPPVGLLDLIRATIAPETWRGGAARGTVASMRLFAGLLVVTQTPENHLALARLLSDFRGHLGRQVARVEPPRPEGLFTRDARLVGWVADLLARARAGKLSEYSSVVVKDDAGRRLARIGGVWFDTALGADDRVVPVAPGTPAAEALVGAPAGLGQWCRSESCAVVRVAPGLAVCFDPAGLGERDHPDVARILKALGKQATAAPTASRRLRRWRSSRRGGVRRSGPPRPGRP